MSDLLKLKESLDKGEVVIPEFIKRIKEVERLAELKSSNGIRRETPIVPTKEEFNVVLDVKEDLIINVEPLVTSTFPPTDIEIKTANNDASEYIKRIEKQNKQLKAIAEVITITSEIDDAIKVVLDAIDEYSDELPKEFIEIIKNRYPIQNRLTIEDYVVFIK